MREFNNGLFNVTYTDSDCERIKRNTRKIRIIFSLVFLLAAVILFGVDATEKMGCTEKVTAVVTENKTQSVDIPTGTNRGAHKNYTGVAPVFEYTIDGMTYTSSNELYTDPPAFKVGEVTEIYVNPDNPYEIYAPRGNIIKILAFAALGIWVVFIIAFVIIQPAVEWGKGK